MAFTYVALAAGTTDGSGTTLDASSSLNVAAGDLLVAWVKGEDAMPSFAIAKNSGSPTNDFTFDAADDEDLAGVLHSTFGYLLSAAADATATFRLTLSTPTSFRRFFVMQFRPDSGFAVTKDAGAGLGQGFGSAPASASINPLGTSIVAFGAVGLFGTRVVSLPLIDAAAGTFPPGMTTNGTATAWYQIGTGFSGGTGNASATLASDVDWICHVVAFKQVGTGPTTSFPPYSMNPMSKLIVR